MPTVTVSQPSVIKVKVDGDSSKIRNISSSQVMAVKSAVDVDMAGANTGDVLTYDSTTKLFAPRPVTANTEIKDLIPSLANTYNLGSETHPWKSLYVTGETVYLGGVVISQEPTTGSMTIAPAPTPDYPTPKGIMVTPRGNFLPVSTVNGKPVANGNYTNVIANTDAYLAFTGYDAGFF